jgi:hypothetical protein
MIVMMMFIVDHNLWYMTETKNLKLFNLLSFSMHQKIEIDFFIIYVVI